MKPDNSAESFEEEVRRVLAEKAVIWDRGLKTAYGPEGGAIILCLLKTPSRERFSEEGSLVVGLSLIASSLRARLTSLLP